MVPGSDMLSRINVAFNCLTSSSCTVRSLPSGELSVMKTCCHITSNNINQISSFTLNSDTKNITCKELTSTYVRNSDVFFATSTFDTKFIRTLKDIIHIHLAHRARQYTRSMYMSIAVSPTYSTAVIAMSSLGARVSRRNSWLKTVGRKLMTVLSGTFSNACTIK